MADPKQPEGIKGIDSFLRMLDLHSPNDPAPTRFERLIELSGLTEAEFVERYAEGAFGYFSTRYSWDQGFREKFGMPPKHPEEYGEKLSCVRLATSHYNFVPVEFGRKLRQKSP